MILESDIIRDRVIHRVLERQVEKYGNRTFMYFKDKVFGYEDLDQRANRIACGLQGLGIKKGDKVAIILPNCPEFVFLMVGLSKLGAIEAPLVRWPLWPVKSVDLFLDRSGR